MIAGVIAAGQRVASGGGGGPTITTYPGEPTWPVTPITALGTRPLSTINTSDPRGPFWRDFGGGGVNGRAELFSIKAATGGTFTVDTSSSDGYPYIKIRDATGAILASGQVAFGQTQTATITAVTGNEYIVEVHQGNAGSTTTYVMTLSGSLTLDG